MTPTPPTNERERDIALECLGYVLPVPAGGYAAKDAPAIQRIIAELQKRDKEVEELKEAKGREVAERVRLERDATDECNRLKKELASLRGEVAKQGEYVLRLKHAEEKYGKQLAEKDELLRETIAECGKAREVIAAKDAEIGSLKNRWQQDVAEMISACSKRHALRSDVDLCEAALSKLQASLSLHQESVRGLGECLEAIDAETGSVTISGHDLKAPVLFRDFFGIPQALALYHQTQGSGGKP